jgi:hypothetical protein
MIDKTHAQILSDFAHQVVSQRRHIQDHVDRDGPTERTTRILANLDAMATDIDPGWGYTLSPQFQG